MSSRGASVLNAVVSSLLNEPPTTNGPPFIPASKFIGARAGYVFTKGDKGLGYLIEMRLHRSLSRFMRMASSTTTDTTSTRRSRTPGGLRRPRRPTMDQPPEQRGL